MRRPVQLAIAILLAHTGSAVAQSGVCVQCFGPDRYYSCTIKDAEKVKPFRGSQRAHEVVCISELARVGDHKSCRVSTGFSGPCVGQPHEIDVSKLGAEPDAAANTPVEGEAKAAKPQLKGPPETLEQLARETFAKSKEQISAADEGMKKAGNAVGGAAKKTWDCVVSLFSKC